MENVRGFGGSVWVGGRFGEVDKGRCRHCDDVVLRYV